MCNFMIINFYLKSVALYLNDAAVFQLLTQFVKKKSWNMDSFLSQCIQLNDGILRDHMLHVFP